LVVAAIGCGTSSQKPVDEQPQEMLGKPPTPEDDPFFYAVRPPDSARAETSGTIGKGDAQEPQKSSSPSKAPEPKQSSPDEPEDHGENASQPKVARDASPQLDALRDKLLHAEQKLADQQARELQLKTTNLQLQNRLEELEGERASHRRELADEQRDLEKTKQRLEAARRELADAQKERAEADRERARAQRDLEETKRALASARRAPKRRPAPKHRSAPKETAKSETPDGAQCFSCVKICPLKGDCSEDAELVCGWGTGEREADAGRRARAECNGTLDRLRATEFSRIEGGCPAATCR
jgi:hypothetical protein